MLVGVQGWGQWPSPAPGAAPGPEGSSTTDQQGDLGQIPLSLGTSGS